MISGGLPSGRIHGSKCPGALELVTFIPAAPWRQLLPDDDVYDLFRWAWHQQPLPVGQHKPFWQASLKLWPLRGGQLRTHEYLAGWVNALRREGLSDSQIAGRLGYPLDTLRRRGALRLADDLAADRPSPDLLRMPLPMVWAPEVDGLAPRSGSLPSFVALAVLGQPATRQHFANLGSSCA